MVVQQGSEVSGKQAQSNRGVRITVSQYDDSGNFVGASAGEVQPIKSLENAHYSERVLGQRKMGDFHDFPDAVDSFAAQGKQTISIGGDGNVYTKIEVYGSYRGNEGSFEWFIKHDDMSINHRLFRPDNN